MVNEAGNSEIIGRLLFTDFLLPFEITSILLLAAIIGAVILAKKKL
jgi:NADH-quinone oxidoreductase subunit J